MVLADSPRISRVPGYSGYKLSHPHNFGYGTFTPSGPPFQTGSPIICMQMSSVPLPRASPHGLGSSPFARRYSGNHYYFLFLQLLRCFSSLRLPYHITMVMYVLHTHGLPHSDTPGSALAYNSPEIFAVCRVLLRHLVPRHPSCALCSSAISTSSLAPTSICFSKIKISGGA